MSKSVGSGADGPDEGRSNAAAADSEAVYVEGYAEGFLDGLSDEVEPTTTRGGVDSQQQFDKITDHLKASINQQRLVAVFLALGAIAVSVFAIQALPDASLKGLNAIREAALNPDGSQVANGSLAPLVTVYEIIRTTGYAALLGGLVYGMFNMARAALDQATRFDKRLVAARFLDYAIHTDNASKEQMEHALKVLEAWGANVESAYTHVKVRGKTTEAMSFSIGKDGVSMQNGQAVK